MIFRYLILIILLTSLHGFSQNQNSRNNSYYKSTNIGIGYSYNFGEPNKKKFHLLNIEVNKSRFGGIHGSGFQYGFGTEIGLNTDKFTIAPKIGGIIYYQFIVIGSEIATYTDFNKLSLRFIPMFGIGAEKIRLNINPHIILSNKDFQPINKGLLNLTVNLSLGRKKVELK